MKHVLLVGLLVATLVSPLRSAPLDKASKKELTVDLCDGVKMRFVRIEPGSFTMGSPKGEEERQDNETPHKVTLTKAYYLSATLVTQAQWEQVMGKDANRSYLHGQGRRREEEAAGG